MKITESIVKDFVNDALKGNVDELYCETMVKSLGLEKDEDLDGAITRELENQGCYCHDDELSRFGFSIVGDDGHRTDILDAANEIDVGYNDLEDKVFEQAIGVNNFIFFSLQEAQDAVLLEKHFSVPGRVALTEFYKELEKTEPNADLLCENWTEYTEQEVLDVFGKPDFFGDPQLDLQETINKLKKNNHTVLSVPHVRFPQTESPALMREKEYTYLISTSHK